MEKEIKKKFKRLKDKRSFCIKLGKHFNIKGQSIEKNWMTTNGYIPESKQAYTLEAINTQLKTDAVTVI